MRGRFVTLVVLNFILLSLAPSSIAQEEAPEWRTIGIDPEDWTDGPEEEDTPTVSYTHLTLPTICSV